MAKMERGPLSWIVENRKSFHILASAGTSVVSHQ